MEETPCEETVVSITLNWYFDCTLNFLFVDDIKVHQFQLLKLQLRQLNLTEIKYFLPFNQLSMTYLTSF